MKKQSQLRAMVFAACLTAISIVLTRYIGISIGDVYRFGFGKLPVVLASFWLGPLWGIGVGAVSDIVGALITTGCNPLFTIPAAICGALPWLFLKIVRGKKNIFTVTLSTIAARVITSGLLLTLLLAYVYGWFNTKFEEMLTVRLITSVVESVVEGIVAYFLVTNKSMNRILENNRVLWKY